MRLIREWLELLEREFRGYSLPVFQKDLLAALTVAAVALPLALAFGVASGADAAAGLVTAILAGVLIGILGGAPYQISGPTGAMSAVLIVLAARYGLEGVWVAGALAGLILLLLAVFRLGRVVTLIPAPVISGFTSGIAAIIALGQVDNALGISTPAAESILEKVSFYFETGLHPNPQAVVLTVLVAILMLGWSRLRISQRIPGALVGILAATLLAVIAGWEVPVIGNIPRSILLDQRLRFASIPWEHLGELLVPAMSIAALAAIESLLCGAVGGNMTGVRIHNSIELAAQGLGNFLIPFFGGVPATAAIARTSVNIKSGGVTRLVPILHGLILLLAALAFASLIGRIPLAALAGILIVTAWRMNEFHAIRFYFGRRLKHAMAAFLITFAATVLLDLTQAIVIGFGVSTLIFMSQMSDLQIDRQAVDPDRLHPPGNGFVLPEQPMMVYYLSGPLFFAAARKLIEAVEAADSAGTTLILSMRGVPLIDATGIEVLRELFHRQQHGGGGFLLTGLQPRVESLLQRGGLYAELGAARFFWSTDRAILSLGGALPEEAGGGAPVDALDETLVITPHEERTDFQW